MCSCLVRRSAETLIRCVVVLLTLTAAVLSAQEETGSFAPFRDRLQTGRAVTVITSSGQTIVGKLSELTDASLALLVDGKVQTIEARDVRRLQQRQSDSLKNGVLIGAAVGTAYAVMWFVRDPNECAGSPCGAEFATSAGLGALIGLGVDALIKRTVTLEVTPAGRAAIVPRRVTVGGGRTSLNVTVRF